MSHQFWLIFRNTTKARETCTAVTWSSVLQALCSATLQRCAASIVSSQACTCKAESLCLVLVKMLVTWMHDFELPGLARLRKTLQSTSCMHWNKETSSHALQCKTSSRPRVLNCQHTVLQPRTLGVQVSWWASQLLAVAIYKNLLYNKVFSGLSKSGISIDAATRSPTRHASLATVATANQNCLHICGRNDRILNKSKQFQKFVVHIVGFPVFATKGHSCQHARML